MTDFIELHCTYNNKSQAKLKANILIKKKLAACVHISQKIQSTYYWKGIIENDDEYLMIAKTHQSLFKQISHEIKMDHPLDCPQIYSLKILEIEKEYLKWIEEILKS